MFLQSSMEKKIFCSNGKEQSLFEIYLLSYVANDKIDQNQFYYGSSKRPGNTQQKYNNLKHKEFLHKLCAQQLKPVDEYFEDDSNAKINKKKVVFFKRFYNHYLKIINVLFVYYEN